MATFKVISEPVVKTEIVKIKGKEDRLKKYVYYAITFDGPVEGKLTHYRKENGLKNYKISLVKGGADEQRKNEQLLLKKVIKDLSEGVDPKYAHSSRITIEERKIEEANKIEDAKVSLDDAIELLKKEKGFTGNKIAEGKEITATSYLSVFNNDFRRYVTVIGKQDDIRAVTKNDIKAYIELHFNPSDKYLNSKGERMFNNWTAKSCTTVKATISSLFSVLVDKDLIAVNPCFGIKIKKDSEKIHIPEPKKDVFELWTKQELDILFTDTDDEEHLFFQTIGKCIYYSCIRKAEMFRIRISMIDFDNEQFAIPAKLTKSARKYKNPNELVYIDIPDNSLHTLKKWIAVRFPDGYKEDNYLFPHKTKTEQKHDYATFNSEWDTFREKLRVKYEGLFQKNIYALKHNGLGAYFHALIKRKDLSSSEVTLKVQHLARHASFTETENYLRAHNLLFEGKREKVNF